MNGSKNRVEGGFDLMKGKTYIVIMKRILIWCGLLLPIGLWGQSGVGVKDFTELHRHAVYGELGGSGGLASVNFEYVFQPWNHEQCPRASLALRPGLSFAPVDKNNGVGIVFPVLLMGYYGSLRHRADIGLGQTLTVTTKGAFFLRMPVTAGYRFGSRKGKWYLRVAYTPIVSYLIDFQWEHWFGLGLGVRI